MKRSAIIIALGLLLGCGSSQPPAAPPPTPSSDAAAQGATLDPKAAAQAAVDAPDRSPEDRALDAGRHPAELLAFFGIEPGMRVADLAAGGGYTSELLARAVGENGRVYGQNSKFFLERFAEGPWSERLKKPIMSRVVRVDREFDEPLGPDVKDLDAVLMILFYHDTVWVGTDRDRMNRTIFGALKSGGVYGIVDHSAREGAGVTDAETLHRIEEGVVKAEVGRAGFQLEAEGDFLRNPEDTRDWNASPRTAGERRGTSDRFVLKFRKP